MSPALHTFLFADLAGFTALTEAHGDEKAADIALEFCAELNRRLPDDAEDLKMLGDACLVRVGTARDAVDLGLQLTSDVGHHGFPETRVGMHTGTAVRRGDDWFGSAVNIAARVAALSGPCEVLVTEGTRTASGNLPGASFEDRGTHQLRHVVEPVKLFSVTRPDKDDDASSVIDPVCRMRLASDPSLVVEHEGTRYFFCSETCADLFACGPERYLRD